MASRRSEIEMTPEEVQAFLAEEKTMDVATIGKDGRPHLVAMWYAVLDGAPVFWTYGRSQKVVNLERDPRLTCLVEAGEVYAELRGTELIGTATLLPDYDDVLRIGLAVGERYTGPVTDEARPFLEAQARKRVAVRVDVERTVSWDHRKLGGGY